MDDSDREATNAEAARHFRRAHIALLTGGGLVVAGILVCWFFVMSSDDDTLILGLKLLLVLMVGQVVAGITTIMAARNGRRIARHGGIWETVLALLGVIAAPLLGFLGLVAAVALSAGGGAWGRPLRVRGRQLHPKLRLGSDWTRGDRPAADDLDQATRTALEALWLHDAQKEHASVPALARVTWLLAAVGAPPGLLSWTQRATLEEIDHANRCFALAAGYGGRQHTVEPMPELLIEGIGRIVDPLSTLVREGVTDGCQLEDFNADVAGRCASVCKEPVTRAVLEQIAIEERGHAELSWAIVAWVLERDPARARAAIARALADLDSYPRPTAVSAEKRALVAHADPSAMAAHGRIRDDEWAAAWHERLAATRARMAALLAGTKTHQDLRGLAA